MHTDFSPRTLSGVSRLAGVVGWPVAHSKSPRLHGFWLAQYDIDGAYVPLAIAPEDFSQSVLALKKMGFAGVNVTIPHKESALAICDDVSDQAKRIGAVNTLTFCEDGSIFGENSDCFGFIENLYQNAPNRDFTQRSAVVLGAGGASRAVIVALLDAGLPEIRIANRTKIRAEKLVDELDDKRLRVIDWPIQPRELREASLLVNTTSLGLSGHGEEGLDIDLGALPRDALVNDIVYVPLMTGLLREAQKLGNPVVDGLGMLLHQARPGFSRWFGKEPEVTENLRQFVLAKD